jgi:hypothetical protein
MHASGWRVLQRVSGAWQDAMHHMRRMNSAVSAKPRPESFFELAEDTEDSVKIDVHPVVLNLPERQTGRSADLYVVMKGWLVFEGPDFKALPLRTKTFGTEMAYFRKAKGSLEHVYGVHYDMDEERAGHPVFHAQVKSFSDLGEVANDFFELGMTVQDHMRNLLGTVRVPSAQMDLFSALTQVCADHLFGPGASEVAREGFVRVRTASDFMIGAAHRLAYLNSAPATSCYRSTHWYKSPMAK